MTNHHLAAKLLLLLALPLCLPAQNPTAPVLSCRLGDSRNCGDVVMPAIAGQVVASGASFYWHLGDFRAIYDFDEDMAPPHELHLDAPHLSIINYLQKAWPDFIEHQLHPFGKLEVFLGHRQSRVDFSADARQIRGSVRKLFEQPAPSGAAPGRWRRGGPSHVLSLGHEPHRFPVARQRQQQLRRGADEMDPRAPAADRKSSDITTVVAGMHEALPGSKG